ncbi:MAG: T9SS type A sorting domain-containing protein [Bacteroidia bacterium]
MIKPYLFFSLALFSLLPNWANAQCTPLDNAIVGITMAASSAGTNNRSGLAYNPGAELYYSVNGGSANYPIDTYDPAGNLVNDVVSGFDYRGAWWNPDINQFEGNGFSALGIFAQTLVAGTAYPSGMGTTIFTANQPGSQSAGDLDYDSNEIIYYDDGFIYRYNRVDNGLLGSYLILDLPVSKDSINSNTVVYTGCEGREIGVYDFNNQRLLFINKATGKYNGFCQLPASAPQRSSLGMSYANGLFWLFDAGVWNSYQVASIWPTAIEDQFATKFNVYPNPVQDQLNIQVEGAVLDLSVEILNLQGQSILTKVFKASEELTINLIDLASGTYYARIQSGDQSTSKVIVKQ